MKKKTRKVINSLENNCSVSLSTDKELSDKLEIIESNKLDSRLEDIFFSSVPPTAIATAVIALFPSTIPIIINFLVFMGITLPLTKVNENLVFLHSKRNKLKEFSNAKTESQIIEEFVNYKIEKERNITLYELIEDNAKLLDDNNLVKKYTNNTMIPYSEDSIRTPEEFNNSIEVLRDKLEKQREELDILITKKQLYEYFSNIRKKISVKKSILYGGITFALIYSMNLSILRGFTNGVSPYVLSLILSTIFGPLSVSAYKMKKYKDNKKAFQNINDRLGENAILDLSNNNEEKELNKEYNNLKDKMKETILKLGSEEKTLNSLIKNSKEKEKSIKEKGINYDLNDIIYLHQLNDEENTYENAKQKVLKR